MNDPAPQPMQVATQEFVDELLEQNERLRQERNEWIEEALRRRSWAGLMSTVDEHYPEDVFDGSSNDPGSRILTLLREIDRLRLSSQPQDSADDPVPAVHDCPTPEPGSGG
jgi:hypothetical protein